jgi:protein O-mannosyl-transferase
MTKKQQLKKSAKQKSLIKTSALPLLKPLSTIDKMIHSISKSRIQLLLITTITFMFYGNSVFNDYVLDDGMFVNHNQFVQKGFDGIYDLLTKETMYGYVGNASGGRWHPLSLITFAVENQYFGNAPHFSHFINVLLLALTGIIMILFLRRHIFKSSPIAAFIISLLFIIHPIHTEAIANIKSRDELLSWLFLLLTMYCSMNFLTNKNYWQLLFSLVFYFLGLMSKENGVSFIAILPLTFYFFTKEKWTAILFTTLPFVIVFGIYWLLRIAFVPFVPNSISDVIVLNAPYLLATSTQRFATELMVLGKYMLLLFYPNPLSCDYSYNAVPYVNFSDWQVWLSVIVQATLLLYALVKLKEKNLVAYGILFYFCSIVLYSNLINVGNLNMGERFLYQPSFGFCIALIVLSNELVQKIKFKNVSQKFTAICTVCIAVFLLSGFQTIRRNSEWATNISLWSADIKKVPNSARAQNGLGTTELSISGSEKDSVKKIALQHDAISHFKRAEDILPSFIDPWLNMGVAYQNMGVTNSRANNLDSVEYCWNRARKLDPNYPKLTREFDPILCTDYINAASVAGSKKDYTTSKRDFYLAIHYNRKSADAWYNLGGFYFVTLNYDSARIAWQQCLKLNPNYSNAKDGLQALPPIKANGN